MSMRTLESAILIELKQVSGKRGLRLKDIMEWSTGPVDLKPDETVFYLPRLQINCAVKTIALGKRGMKKDGEN